jgi:hypothetical protein
MRKALAWSEQAMPDPQPAHRRTRRHLARGLRWLLGLFLLALVVTAGVLVLQLGRARASMARLPTLLATDPAQVGPELAHLAQLLHGAQGATVLWTPLLEWLEPLPAYGPTLAAAPTLLQVAADLADVAYAALPVIEPALSAPAGATALTQLPSLIERLGPHQAELAERLAAIQQKLAPLSPAALAPPMGPLVADLQSTVALLHGAARLGEGLPALIGLDGRAKSYLILVQNNHELRATGGFLSSIGVVSVEAGRIGRVDFQDSYTVGGDAAPFTVAPAPLQRFMNIDRLLLRDVNWSPDLPTTAQVAAALYADSTGVVVDGVITLDLQAAELLVGALEPLNAPGVDVAVTRANFLELVKTLWADPVETVVTVDTVDSDTEDWWTQRKDFIPLIATTALARLEQGDAQPERLLAALGRALETRAIQVWSAEAATSQTLAALGWDGGLHGVAGQDFLALVDSNLGYNKADAAITRALHYTVEWPGDQPQGVATARISYRHWLPVPDPECLPLPRYGLVYDDMIARCYFNFMRLYVPAGSELLAIEGIEADSLFQSLGEGNTQIFGGYVIVPPGTEKTVTLTYRLPPAVRRQGYGLVIQRQAGTLPLTLEATLDGFPIRQSITTGRWRWPQAGTQ